MLWGLHALGSSDESILTAELDHADEQVRTAAIRLLVDHTPPSEAVLEKLNQKASSDTSGLVRLHLASALQRLPIDKNGMIARSLALRSEDLDDHNQPTMLWLGIESRVLSDPSWAAQLAAETPYPLLRRNIARRMSEDYVKDPASVNVLLKTCTRLSVPAFNDIVSGFETTFEGLPHVAPPAAWSGFAAAAHKHSDSGLSDRVLALGAVFGDATSCDMLRSLLADVKGEATRRQSALDALIRVRDSGLNDRLELLLDDPILAQLALRKLASSSKVEHASSVVERLAMRSVEERQILVNTLVTRQQGVAALLDAIAKKKLPRDVLNAFHARQIKSLDAPDLLSQLSEVWGEVKESSDEKKKLLADYKERFDKGALGRADLELGRQTFKTVCGNCHMLLGEGGKIGPDLTGGNRRNLDYLLENIVAPNAIVPEAYRISIIETDDGRILTGVIVEKNNNALVLQTSLEKMSVPLSEVVATKESPNSLMPEGILTALSDQQAKALMAFLMQ